MCFADSIQGERNCGDLMKYENIIYIKVQVKVQVYSLISSLKTYHPTSHFTPLSLDLFIRVPSQLHGEHTVLQPFRRIELIIHIAISVLPGTHFHLSQVKHLRVKCALTIAPCPSLYMQLEAVSQREHSTAEIKDRNPDPDRNHPDHNSSKSFMQIRSLVCQ